MLFIGLIHATICIVAKDALVKEWDVHKGSSVEYQDEILYSFEFHLNKTSSNTIITIWRSNEKPNIGIKEKVNPRVAQFEIIYESENSGTFKSKTDEKPTKFTFTEDDFSHYSTQFLYNNYNYNIILYLKKSLKF